MARTIDGDEASIGWTVQSGVPKPKDVDDRVANVFTPEQLPDPEVQRAAGIDPDLWKRRIVMASQATEK
jgi:hypothetical protein